MHFFPDMGINLVSIVKHLMVSSPTVLGVFTTISQRAQEIEL